MLRYGAILILILSVVDRTQSRSAEIAFEFTGHVRSAFTIISHGIQPGDEFSGIFRFNDDTPVIRSFTGRSDYAQVWPEAEPSFELTVDGITFTGEASSQIQMRVYDNYDPNYPKTLNPPNPLDVFLYSATGSNLEASITFVDQGCTAINGTNLPTAIDLASWDQGGGISLTAPDKPILLPSGEYEEPGANILIGGLFDSISVVPEPSTLALVLCGIAWFAVACFRGRGSLRIAKQQS